MRFFAIAIVIMGHLLERNQRTFGPALSPGIRWAVQVLAKPGAGVLLFFGVSGFVIANQFFKRPVNPMSASFLKNYARRRVLRIEPPYVILLIATFCLIAFAGFRPSDSPRFAAQPQSLPLSLLASLFYSHGVIFGSLPRLFLPGWSLELEVQFYILAPAFFWCLYLTRSRRLRLCMGAAAVLVGTLVACFIPWSSQAPYVQRTMLLYFPYFWTGVMFADAQQPIRSAMADRPIFGSCLGWLGLAVFSVADLCVDPIDSVSGTIYMLGLVAGMTLMFVSVLSAGSTFKTFCSIPLVSMIGGQCYSIYLTHLQVLQLLSPALRWLLRGAPSTISLLLATGFQVVAVLGVGLLFYASIERPFMTDHWPRKVSDWVRGLAARPYTAASRRAP